MNMLAPAAKNAFTPASPDRPAYQSGFGNEFATEALPGALPHGQNSPQQAPYGLYAEQLSGTAFTAPRAHNRRAWLYRIRPAAVHLPFEPIAQDRFHSDFHAVPASPNQLRWTRCPRRPPARTSSTASSPLPATAGRMRRPAAASISMPPTRR